MFFSDWIIVEEEAIWRFASGAAVASCVCKNDMKLTAEMCTEVERQQND